MARAGAASCLCAIRLPDDLVLDVESHEVVPSLDPERHRGSGHLRSAGGLPSLLGFHCRAGAAPVPPGGRV